MGGLLAVCHYSRMRGMVEFEFNGRMVASVCAAAIAMGLMASIYPAWRAARLNTIDAIRSE